MLAGNKGVRLVSGLIFESSLTFSALVLPFNVNRHHPGREGLPSVTSPMWLAMPSSNLSCAGSEMREKGCLRPWIGERPRC
jgi:hypothetical protein